MSDENTEIDQGNADDQAASVEAGEAVENEASQTGESTSESPVLFDGMTGDKLHTSYKDLQGEYTKVNQALKSLEQFGDISALGETLSALRDNPRFQEFVKSENRMNQYGFDENEMDSEQKSALDLVEKISKQTTSAEVERLVSERLGPLEDQIKERALDGVFSEMDAKHPDWRELQDVMGSLAEKLSPEVYSNPTLKDVEMLHTLALAESGKFDDYAAKVYQQQLEQKKQNDTGKPGSHAGKGEAKVATSLAEAFAMAKEAQG